MWTTASASQADDPSSSIELLVGIDVVEIERFRRFLERVSPAQLGSVFTPAELSCVAERADIVPGLAARFAAKEAVVKALGDVEGFSMDWQEIEVRREGGAPWLELRGELAEIARERGVRSLSVSLSHSRTLAVAQVVGLGAAARPRASLGSSARAPLP